MTGQNHAPKVYELVERQTEKPATKAAILFVNREVIMLMYDGETMRVDTRNVRTETLLRVAGDILHVVAGRDEQSSKDRPNAAGGNL